MNVSFPAFSNHFIYGQKRHFANEISKQVLAGFHEMDLASSGELEKGTFILF